MQKNLQSTATMAKHTKEEVKIFGGKASIYTNEYGVWQFRVWLRNENKYVRKSLRTKVKMYAIEQAEELYIEIRNENNLDLTNVSSESRLFIALYIGEIRIIDNFKLY